MTKRTTQLLFVLTLGLGFITTLHGLYELANPLEGDPDWRWTPQYFVTFASMMLVIALAGLWRGPRAAGLLIGTLLTVALGATVPVLSIALLALSLLALGHILFRNHNISPTDSLLVGFVVSATVFSLLLHLPVNNTGTWGLFFAIPLLLGGRYLRQFWPKSVSQESEGLHLYLLHCAIGSAALLHFFVGLMPEIGNDALALHLFIPAYIAQHQMWHFDAATYVWAVQPMLVDWLYTAGYLFVGETGARMVNVGGILLLAALVHRLAVWGGATKISASWAVLLLLVTPLTFLESSSLFIESIWSALVLGGTLALLRLLTKSENTKRDLLLAGLLLGGALAAKTITFTILPVLALALLAGYRRWYRRNLLGTTVVAVVIFLAVGAIPYATAYLLTGNPIFPFFNAYFLSPLFPPENFNPPAIFEQGMAWDTFYRITFDSAQYLEATAGAAGFQWLLLVAPGTVALALARQQRALVIALLAVVWIWLVFSQTAYLRYVYPSFALACALIGASLALMASADRWVWRATMATAVITVILNLFHFYSSTYYGKVDLGVITDARKRDIYVTNTVPIRIAVNLVNELNRSLAPVAFFSAPLTAGLKADALYDNWYTPRFQNAFLSVGGAENLGQFLAREGIDYLVVDDARKDVEYLHMVNEVSRESARIGTISVRQLNDRYRYREELLASTVFKKGWQFSPGSVQLPGDDLQVSVSSPAYTVVQIQPGKKYRYAAEARCASKPATGRLQVNWQRHDGKLSRADIEVFDCTPQTTAYTMDVLAPTDTAHALVYASAHGENPIIFSKISFRF